MSWPRSILAPDRSRSGRPPGRYRAPDFRAALGARARARVTGRRPAHPSRFRSGPSALRRRSSSAAPSAHSGAAASRPPARRREAKCACAFLVGVGEDADVIEARVGDETLELGEFRVRFAGEADDQCRPKRHAWHSFDGSGRAACRRSCDVPGRRMRFSTLADACCSGRSTYRQTFSHSAMASRTSSVIVVG